jgi:hypothetical protein
MVEDGVMGRDLDAQEGWREGTADRHMRNHAGEYHQSGNSQCSICVHPDRAEIEGGYFDGGVTSEEVAEALEMAENSVYRHMRHHIEAVVQPSGAALVVAETLNQQEVLNTNLTRLNGRLQGMLDQAPAGDRYYDNLVKLSKEVREHIKLMADLEGKRSRHTESGEQYTAKVINILKVELSDADPDLWRKLRGALRQGDALPNQ